MLLLPFIFSILFVAIPLALMAAGVQLNWIAWLSIAFGVVGILAIGAQMLGFTPAGRPAKQRSGKSRRPTKTVLHKGPLPELSANKQAQVRRAIRAMTNAGIFAPQSPDPAKLYAGVADDPYPVGPDTVLFALMGANYYHPDFDPALYQDNLAFHDMQVETPADRIEEMIRDLERLSAGALTIADLTVTQDIVDPAQRMVRTDVSMAINGTPVRFSEEHHFKYFPLKLHPLIAGHMPAERRFANLWIDQGAFVTALAPGAVEAINEKLKLTPNSRCQWDWIEPEGSV